MIERNRARPELYPVLYEDLVRRELTEDLGLGGDLTTAAVLPPEARAEARIVTRAEGRLCGVEVAILAFRLLDPEVSVHRWREDGDDLEAGDEIVRIEGRARPLLSAERTALNFLGHLSGVATATRALVERIVDAPAKVVCTRKTTPGLRSLEKYAVRMGGGANHRFRLDDGVLIKDNHLQLGGDVRQIVTQVAERIGHQVKIQVEVDSLEQLEQVLGTRAEAVLLDNMKPQQLSEAVARCRGRVITEASGGIHAGNIEAVAATGVDLISVGWITHSAPALDVSLESSMIGNQRVASGLRPAEGIV